jgi:uncharacterized protein (DUF433 family)
MSDLAEFTTAEVAFVLRQPVKAVKKALDQGPVQATLIKKHGGTVRAVKWPDLIYLFAVRTLQDELTPKARRDFYYALTSAPVDLTSEVRFGHLRVLIGDVKAEVQKRTKELAGLSEKVEFRTDGEPLVKGAGIEVYRIVALLNGGMSPAEICEDYPSLTPETVAAAKAYGEAHPKTGRPYPSKTVKRAIKGAGLEALDDILVGEE